MVDQVAGCAAHTEQLGLRLAIVVTDGCEVLVAIAVDLGCSHDDMPLARPDLIEDRAERHVRLDDGIGRVAAERKISLDRIRDRVGEHQVGFERGPGEATGNHRHGAHRVAQHLTVATERLGEGDDADLGKRRFGGVTHACPLSSSLARYASCDSSSSQSARNCAHASGSLAVAAYSRWNASSRP